MRQKLATLSRLPFTTIGVGRSVGAASAVFSMGGYVAGPPVLAALLRRIPVVVMEPNAVPGFTNRSISRYVARALVSFPETAVYFPKGRTEITGLPVRAEFFQIPPKPRDAVLSILITGGSQGSRTLNHSARQAWPLFRQAGFPVRITHQTGTAEFDEIRARFEESGLEGKIVSFIQDMPAAFAAADLVVCRSGAGAVSELAAARKPSILVPFPYAAEDHQTRNAEAMSRVGAALVVADAVMNGQMLCTTIVQLADQSGRLESMAAAARQFAKPDAARRAADILEEVSRP